MIADQDGTGSLDLEEVHTLLTFSGFKFEQRLLHAVIDAADVDHDGTLNYHEFVPMMVALIEDQDATPLDLDVHDIGTQEEYFRQLFAIADTNQNGVLEKNEVATLLQLTGFKFDKATVTELVEMADLNGDGTIDYDEFVPTMINLLNEAPSAGAYSGVKAALRGASRIDDEDDADGPLDFDEFDDEQQERYFKRLFQIGDVNGDGVLEPYEVKRLLQICGFPLDDDTIDEVVELADLNHDGVIEYEEFVPVMMELMNEAPEERADA
jgi:calmodulin